MYKNSQKSGKKNKINNVLAIQSLTINIGLSIPYGTIRGSNLDSSFVHEEDKCD